MYASCPCFTRCPYRGVASQATPAALAFVLLRGHVFLMGTFWGSGYGFPRTWRGWAQMEHGMLVRLHPVYSGRTRTFELANNGRELARRRVRQRAGQDMVDTITFCLALNATTAAIW